MPYQIHKQRSKRLKTEYIIITQMRNLWHKSTMIDHRALRGTHRYTWGVWQKYFYIELQKKSLPVHFFVEQLADDYVIFNGLSTVHPSWWLKELASVGAIQRRYSDSILIGIGEDYSGEDVLSTRLCRHLADKVIAGLIYEYGLTHHRVQYIDNILLPGWKDALKREGLLYDIVPQKNFDIFRLHSEILSFKKG